MTLRLYNTMNRRLEDFQPIDPKNVRVYGCGPTVYDRAHIGNARANVVFDLLHRVLRHLYGSSNVTFVRNVTDVDDKIIKRSLESGEAMGELTARVLAAFHEDMATLGCLRPTIEPRATDHITHMISMIKQLIDQGQAYEDGIGNVLFRTTAMPNYGALSRLSQEDLIAGARVEISHAKEDPRDFVLWKPKKDWEPESSAFVSPWGLGRPGWHIECSAMALEHLGPTFDIHMGGLDLRFPHHENEIAQSCCANKTEQMARYWVHNGFVTVAGEKMSKSLGNFFTIPDLQAKGYKGEAIRLALLETHYRAPLDLTETKIQAAQNRLDGLYREKEKGGISGEPDLSGLMDDLQTSTTLTNPANFGILGFLQQDCDAWFRGTDLVDSSHIQDMIAMRLAAKDAGDFTRADQIRNQLKQSGVILEDTHEGTTWRWSHREQNN